MRQRSKAFSTRNYLGIWYVIDSEGREMCQTKDRKMAEEVVKNMNEKHQLRELVTE